MGAKNVMGADREWPAEGQARVSRQSPQTYQLSRVAPAKPFAEVAILTSPAPQGGFLSTIGAMLGGATGQPAAGVPGTPTPRPSNRMGMGEVIANSVARNVAGTIGRQVANQIWRGIFGTVTRR